MDSSIKGGATGLTDDERYAAIARRDTGYDGLFVYGVRTTGVYCRPGCGARPARRQNISLHACGEAARVAGFRPCKRCRPDEAALQTRQADMVRRACRLIEEAETPPSLTMLARTFGLSPYYFHRVFSAIAGVTPKRYADACRASRLQAQLGSAESVTQAIYGAGFNAPSRFYESAPSRLGMSPGAFRKGGVDTLIRFAVGQCSLGAILIAATQTGICTIAFDDDPEVLVRGLQMQFPKATLVGGDAVFEGMVARVVGLVEAPARLAATAPDLPLDIRGTAFQQRVWQALRAIPSGSTASYTEIAARIGAPAAVRAVAGACASNLLAVAIPCHRVVRSDGALSGYRWGIVRKRALLERETAD